MPSPTTLYRFFSIDDQLLYIGITKNGQTRWDQHTSSKEWWPLVDHVTTEHFPNRDAALDAEKAAIQNDGPLFNVVHNGEKPSKRRRRKSDVYLRCSACGDEVTDGDLVVHCHERGRYRREKAEWEAELREHHASEAGVPYDQLEGWQKWTIPGRLLLDMPDKAPWLAYCHTCDPGHSVAYSIHWKEIVTHEQVLRWTAHLLEKGWVDEETDFTGLVGSAVHGGNGPLVIR